MSELRTSSREQLLCGNGGLGIFQSPQQQLGGEGSCSHGEGSEWIELRKVRTLAWLHMRNAISVSMEVGPRYRRVVNEYCRMTLRALVATSRQK